MMNYEFGVLVYWFLNKKIRIGDKIKYDEESENK